MDLALVGDGIRNGRDPEKRGRNRSSPGRRRRSRSPLDRSSSRGDSKANRRVYVANVAFDVKWNDLKDLFREKIGNVAYCQLFEDEQGRSRGCGLVEFNDSPSAEKAIEILHRYNYRNRELVVKEDLDCERDQFGRLILPSRGSGAGKGGGGGGSGSGGGRPKDRDPRGDLNPEAYLPEPVSLRQVASGYGAPASPVNYNTFGLSPQFLESLGLSGPLNNRVFVANLDYKVGEKKLEEIFRLAGKVLRVRLYSDSQGQSKGHGTVEFEHPVEAVQAISMFHDQKLYGRPMSIRMDKYECEEMPEVLPSKLPSGLEGVGKGLGIGGQPLNIGKSLLGQTVGPQATPAQASQQSSLSAPSVNTGTLSALGSLAGGLNQLPLSQAGLNQMNSSTAVSGASALGASSLNLPAFGAERSYSGLVGNHSSGQMNLSGLGGAAGGGLSSLGTTAQSVLAAAASLSGSNSLSGVNAGLGLNNAGSVSGGLGVYNNYSNYEREFREDKFAAMRVPQPMNPISDTIVVRNLPPNFSWQNLRDRFNEIGEVRFAELQSRGTAVVRFHSDRDAQRAVDLMNGIRVDNRALEVNLYY